MSYNPLDTGRRLVELRKSRKLSQKSIAELRGITQSGIAKQESGENTIGENGLVWYADFYGVSVDYILCRTDIPNIYVTTGVGQSDAILYTQKSPSPQEQERAAQEVDNALNGGEVDVPPAMQRAIEQIVRQVLAERDTQS